MSDEIKGNVQLSDEQMESISGGIRTIRINIWDWNDMSCPKCSAAIFERKCTFPDEMHVHIVCGACGHEWDAPIFDPKKWDYSSDAELKAPK
jgi:hypothetical protein